jgi:hypothetical protein
VPHLVELLCCLLCQLCQLLIQGRLQGCQLQGKELHTGQLHVQLVAKARQLQGSLQGCTL